MNQHITVGNKVKLIFTNEVGIVKKYYDNETVIVEVAGTTFPIFLEHLEKIVENTPIETPKPVETKKPIVFAKPVVNKEKHLQQAANKIKESGVLLQNMNEQNLTDKGIILALQPFYTYEENDYGDPISTLDYFLVHLCNQSRKAIYFKYNMESFNNNFTLNNTISGTENIIIHAINIDELNDNINIAVEIQIINPNQNQLPVFNKSLKIRPKQVIKPKNYIAAIKDEGWIVEICNKLPEIAIEPAKNTESPAKINQIFKTIEENEKKQQDLKFVDLSKQKVFVNSIERVVDLHIENLVNNFKHLKNHEIITIQIKQFEKEIHEALIRKEPKITVVHGIGKGKLKQEIINLLREYPLVKYFKNELHPKYGYGATEIFFEY